MSTGAPGVAPAAVAAAMAAAVASTAAAAAASAGRAVGDYEYYRSQPLGGTSDGPIASFKGKGIRGEASARTIYGCIIGRHTVQTYKLQYTYVYIYVLVYKSIHIQY